MIVRRICEPNRFVMTLAGVVMLLSVPAFGRETKTINDGWLFSQHGRTDLVHLPHCWNTDAYSTADYYRGTGVYSRVLRVPEAAAGKRVYLRIDGAASKSAVSVDSVPVGSHIGGYSSHFVDLTSCLADGGEHTVTIAVDNSDTSIPPYSADFTFMGGLYRDVALVVCDPVHLDFSSGPAEGFKVAAECGNNGEWSVKIDGTINNSSASAANPTVVASLRDSDGREIASASKKLRIKSGNLEPFSLAMDKIASPALWSPEEPVLYTVEVSVNTGGSVSDSGMTCIGFRTFGFDSEGRFLLNGRPYKLRGMCRHQDQAPMGIALTDEMHRRDMRLIKDLGANFIRISHYPQDDAILEMCDRMGLIAWEEIPVINYVPDSPDFEANAEFMLRDMIRRHYNHPSVAMWGYMNEILLSVPKSERDRTFGRTHKLADRLEKVLHEEDMTRLSTMAFHGSDIYHEAGISYITDVQGWNLYQGWYGGRLDEFEKFLSRQHREHPEHRLIVSEYGAGSDLRLHSLVPEPFDFSIEYQQKFLEHYLPVIEDSAFVAGASHWNFIDFSSASRAESMTHINNKGLVTNSRRPKDVYQYYRAMWHSPDNDTIAHIAVTDWAERCEVPDSDGKVVRPIKVYTNLPEIILCANNGKLLSAATDNCTAIFDVELRNGKNIFELRDTHGRILDTKTIDVKIFDVRDGKLDTGTDDLAINVGSNCYFISGDSGQIWLPDCEYRPGALYGHIGGKKVNTQDEIALTPDQPLFQRALSGLEEYRISLVPGRYEVELLFAEQGKPSDASVYMLGRNAGSGSEGSAMNIDLNGNRVETAFSPAESVGYKAMLSRKYIADVADDGLIVKFGGKNSLSGIKVHRLHP